MIQRCFPRQTCQGRISKRQSIKFYRSLFCEVALINKNFMPEKKKTHNWNTFQILVFSVFCQAKLCASERTRGCTRTCQHKPLVAASHPCRLSDGMINDPQPWTHPSRTGEAPVITMGICLTDPSKYQLSLRQQQRNATWRSMDNPC